MDSKREIDSTRGTDGNIEATSIRNFVGRRIRGLRIEKGMTQEKLAELSGLHPTYIGQIERGEKNATIECASRIVTALGTSLQDFFQDAEKAPVPSDDPLYKLYDALSRLRPDERDEVCEIMLRILALLK